MPLKIPAGAKVVTDKRLDLVRIVSTLNASYIEGDDGLKSKIKKTLKEKGASYAVGELVNAELRPTAGKGKIDAAKLYELTKGRKPAITFEQFLSTLTVSKQALEKFLGADAIEKITTPGAPGEPGLFTEFAEGVEFDLDQLAEQLATAFGKAVNQRPIKVA